MSNGPVSHEQRSRYPLGNGVNIPYKCDDKGKIDPDKIEDLMPWSDKIPEDCRKKNR